MRETEQAEKKFLGPLSADEWATFMALLTRLLAAEAN